ncbi:hypothetical protein TNCV_3520721 [Trichonephila clavipes]|nr:hypothetical protein TNCV_3520721 [Trichonephila clavipes]
MLKIKKHRQLKRRPPVLALPFPNFCSTPTGGRVTCIGPLCTDDLQRYWARTHDSYTRAFGDGPRNFEPRSSDGVIGGRGREVGGPLPYSRLFFRKIGVEPSQTILSPVWFSKRQLTTGVKKLTPSCYDEFREPKSGTVSQVVLATR